MSTDRFPRLRFDFDEAHARRQVREQLWSERARRERFDNAMQAAIAVLTLAAVWLLTSDPLVARWGHVVGLASQPFWIAASWRARPRQWGMFVVAVAMCGLWLRGIVTNFF